MTGRWAPSPTGEFHLGNLRTGLLAWLFARSRQAKFCGDSKILMALSDQNFMISNFAIFEASVWTGDGPVVRQSDRLTLYKDAIEELKHAVSRTDAGALDAKSSKPPLPACTFT